MRKERTRPERASWVFSAAPLVLVASVVVAAVAPAARHRPGLRVVGRPVRRGVPAAPGLGGPRPRGPRHRDGVRRHGGEPGHDHRGAQRAGAPGGGPGPVDPGPLVEPAHHRHPFAGPSRPGWPAPSACLAVVALVIVIVAECGRLPVDNPSTHLELTMIHEAMVLEYAGPDLALVKLAEAMRLAFLVALLAVLFVPWGIATAPGLGHLALGLVASAPRSPPRRGAGRGRGVVAKLRLFRVPELMAGAFVLSVLAVISVVVA